MKREPTRLRDDPHSPSELRADLMAEAARMEPVAEAATATAAGVARLRASLESGAKLSEIGRLATSASAKGAGALWATKSLLWIVGAVGAAAVVVGAVAIASHGNNRTVALPSNTVLVTTPSAPSPTTTLESPVPAPAGATVSGVDPEIPAELAPAERGKDSVRPAQPTNANAGAHLQARPPAEPSQDLVAAEMADLVRLRQLARTDPGGALAAADEGTRRFPTGLFGQEREAIAIGALSQLGRTADAKARARSFLARYPHSPFVEKVEQEVGPD
jgi:hypothetical protein